VPSDSSPSIHQMVISPPPFQTPSSRRREEDSNVLLPT
jgi:hypothetical protein